jgi:hypothetical protein
VMASITVTMSSSRCIFAGSRMTDKNWRKQAVDDRRSGQCVRPDPRTTVEQIATLRKSAGLNPASGLE